jgi:hypothetical protein
LVPGEGRGRSLKIAVAIDDKLGLLPEYNGMGSEIQKRTSLHVNLILFTQTYPSGDLKLREEFKRPTYEALIDSH